ncbi:MAG: YciI family protein [Myxococcota bacterium]|nr:YciI family protein [Myxococcota bacterium]
MPLYVWIGRDGERGAELRKQHRPAHIDNLAPLSKAGRIRFAGPLKQEDGSPCGSVIVFEAENLEAAREIAHGDPYTTSGVFGDVEVFESLQVFPEADE